VVGFRSTGVYIKKGLVCFTRMGNSTSSDVLMNTKRKDLEAYDGHFKDGYEVEKGLNTILREKRKVKITKR
jgi:hypothetical protein